MCVGAAEHRQLPQPDLGKGSQGIVSGESAGSTLADEMYLIHGSLDGPL
jgi:hypothetical protein